MANYVDYLNKSWPDAALAGYTKPGWYFWDEAYCCTGPYDTKEQAEKALDEYGEELNGNSL